MRWAGKAVVVNGKPVDDGALPGLQRIGFGTAKRQLRSAKFKIIDSAIAGSEPLLDGWLSADRLVAALRQDQV